MKHEESEWNNYIRHHHSFVVEDEEEPEFEEFEENIEEECESFCLDFIEPEDDIVSDY